MKQKHRNIPVFVPHEGCPHACVFCNQKSITHSSGITPHEAQEEFNKLKSPCEPGTQIAFFGGSFTAIGTDRMTAFLNAAAEAVKRGAAESIRLSTRPDAVDDEILNILRSFPVRSIELGIQSISDRVLSACGRGHNAAQSIDAMKRVKKAGFELGGQMMTGLPESTREDELETARAICCCGADCSRIYPTVVLRGTKLYELAREGKYIPRTREESAEDAASAYRVFFDHGVNVLRVGLCANEGLSDEDCFGSFDPAVGEMCLSIIYRDEIEKKLVSSLPPRGSQIKIYVPEGDVSQAVGQNKSNRIYLTVKYGLSRIGFYENCSLTRFEAEIEVD